MSIRSPVTRNDGTSWNSTCATSGAPEPAVSAVRSFVYSAEPCPALTRFTLMFGWAVWNMSTCCCRSGTHDHSVRVARPPRAAVVFLVVRVERERLSSLASRLLLGQLTYETDVPGAEAQLVSFCKPGTAEQIPHRMRDGDRRGSPRPVADKPDPLPGPGTRPVHPDRLGQVRPRRVEA